jgi:arylsulfatase A-like enzyme
VDIIAPSEGLRTKDWKYFRYRNDPDHEELYNLEKDPLEKDNLVGKKKYRNKLKKMQERFGVLSAELEADRLLK